MTRPDLSSARPASPLWPWVWITGMVCATLVFGALIALQAYRLTPLSAHPTDLAILSEMVDPSAALMPQTCAIAVALRPHADAAMQLCAAEADRGWPSAVPILVGDNLTGIGGPE